METETVRKKVRINRASFLLRTVKSHNSPPIGNLEIGSP